MNEPMNLPLLKKEMDKVIGEVFMGKDAFLASLLCNLEMKWDSRVSTASTNGVYVRWNPDFFLNLPHKTRVAVNIHELWHVARLHMIRRGSRDPRIWNYACDLRINEDMLTMGYTFAGTTPWLLANLPPEIRTDITPGMPEEDIYSVLLKHSVVVPESDFENDFEQGDGDVQAQAQVIIDLVRRAHEAAKACGSPGISGDMVQWFDKFLAPVVPWEQELQQWFLDMSQGDYSYSRPNQKYADIIMPTLRDEQGRLDKLHFYVDVSGSITAQQIIRFNSELKHIKETFNPQELVIVLFDTEITEEIVITESDLFNRVKVIGGGGTCLKCVRSHIEDTSPTAAIIFSDMKCIPMEPLSSEVPILWVVVDNPSFLPEFGKAIYIKE